MSANDLLTLLTRLIFILLGIVTVYNYARHRNKTRRDIALTFSCLAIPFATPYLLPANGTQPNPLAQILNWIALAALPFALLRLLRYFRPVPLQLMRLALFSTIFAWVILFVQSLLSKGLLTVIVVGIIIYFAAINAYAMVAFVRSAITTYGVVRQRLRFAAAGAGLLAGVFVWLILAVLLRPLIEIITPLVLLTAVASALCFYIGFAPPRWLRSAWQAGELRAFLTQVGRENLSVDETFKDLSVSANRAVGGMVAAIAQRDEASKGWMLRHLSSNAQAIQVTADGDGLFWEVQQEQKPRFVRQSQTLSGTEGHILQTLGADTLLLAPIGTAEHLRGILLVFLKYGSLFIEDDLELVGIMAQQSAIFLENSGLVAELHQHSVALEKRVQERTAELEETQK